MTQNAGILRERDEILNKLLYHIASSPSLSSGLILQGGGALHFVYSSPRYSNDLDFVCPNFRQDRDALIAELAKEFKIHDTVGYSPRIAKVEDGYFRVSYDPSKDQGLVVRVEVKDNTAEDFYPAKGAFSPLLVETPQEIYADKIVASLHRMARRGSLKSTDLFDLDHLVENLNGEAGPDKIDRKSASYGHIGWSRETAEQVMRYIVDPANHDRFRKDIRRTLLPDVFANRHFDREFFEKAAEQFVKIREHISPPQLAFDMGKNQA
jgi:hypothetical protein